MDVAEKGPSNWEHAYYVAIGERRYEDAKRIFDRMVEAAERSNASAERRRTTKRYVAQAIATVSK